LALPVALRGRTYAELVARFRWPVIPRLNLGAACVDVQPPRRLALIHVTSDRVERLSFGDLSRRSNRMANALNGLGLRRGDRVAVILLTVPVGVGVAVAGSLMPLVVRESWPKRPVLATSVYATGISLGAAVSAAVAVPLSHALGCWRDALSFIKWCSRSIRAGSTGLFRGKSMR